MTYPYSLNRVLTYGFVAFIAFLIMCAFLVCPVHGDVIANITPIPEQTIFTYGATVNYSQVVLPNNSYVHQGENISQGNFYDLSGMYGWSGEFCMWNDDWDNAGLTYPDHIVSLDTSKIYETYIDPQVWPAGKWYYFDGGNNLTGDSFGNANEYAFAVVAPASPNWTPAITTQTLWHNITILQNGEGIQVPVSYTITITPTPTSIVTAKTTEIQVPATTATQPPQAADLSGASDNSAPASVVTPSPLLAWLPVLAVLGMAMYVRRWKR